jgi:hypothetical protein
VPNVQFQKLSDCSAYIQLIGTKDLSSKMKIQKNTLKGFLNTITRLVQFVADVIMLNDQENK